MSTSPTAARTEVYTLLAPLAVPKQVVVQPAVKLPLPKPVTIALSPAGQNPTEFRVRVSVYADASADSVTAQARAEQYSYAADEALTPLPRGDWTTTYETSLECWVSTAVVDVAREDF